MTKAVAAVDLGATSGRVMLGYVSHNELRLVPVSRFANGPVSVDVGAEQPELHWDVTGLYNHAIAGLTTAAHQEPDIRSIGIDSWAVDYGLLRGGVMQAEPFHYRDARTARGVQLVHERVPCEELYAATGLQHLVFNTVYQLAEDNAAGRLEGVDSFLLVPDLLSYWLTGAQHAERTNASTTGLLNVHNRHWDADLINRTGIPARLFPSLVDPGTAIGSLLPDVATTIGAPGLQVTSVGSHDTASAVVAVPATDENFAYISCGTWALVGVELENPVVSAAGLAANFTNEGGVDSRVRYLHNVMGLWLLSESIRQWESEGESIDLPSLLDAASAVSGPVAQFDANDQAFLAPGNMPERIATWCREHNQPVPSSRAEFVRSIIESLAEAFAHTVRTAGELSGKTVSTIHIVGGGSQNALLCQLTANRSGLTVLAGPVEATAIGNVLVQARALGIVNGSLESLRALVSGAFLPVTYTPQTRSR